MRPRTRWTVLLALACAGGLLLAGCRVTPKGWTVFRAKSKVEYEKADLMRSGAAPTDPAIKLKWFEDNGFVTTKPLAPGLYLFRAKNYEGGYFGKWVNVQPGIMEYEMPEGSREGAESDPARAGVGGGGPAGLVQVTGMARAPVGDEYSRVTASLKPPPAAAPISQVFVLVFTNTISTQQVPLLAGKFALDLRDEGPARIEVHVRGPQPLRAVAPKVLLKRGELADLGELPLAPISESQP